MSDSINSLLYAVAEVTRGTTPATPALSKVRHTACTLGLSKETNKSEEITGSRNLADFRHGNKQVGGDINFELSAGSFDLFLQAVLMGTWALDILKIGAVRRPFSLLRHFSDLSGGSNPWHVFTGCEFNKLSLKLTPGKIITGSFGLIGKDMNDPAALAPVGSTYPAASATPVMDAFTGSLEVDAVGVSIVTELTLNIENGISPDFVLFSDTSELPTLGEANISGELGIRFINSDMMQRFIDETETALTFTIEDSLGNTYDFKLPKVKLNGGQPDTSGTGPINLKIPFQAIHDSTLGTTLQIERVIA